MINNSTISCYEKHAQDYDAYQLAVVPGYQEMLDLIASTARRYLPDGANIIDLGCGTGNASRAILNKMEARIFLLDGSMKMMNIAALKISKQNSRAILGKKVADLCSHNWDEGLPFENYDAIVSTLVLEHLPFNSYKKLIKTCLRLLKPGGWLISTEGFEELEADMKEWFFQEMEERRKVLDPAISESIALLRDEDETHYYCSKSTKCRWWKQAGFSRVNTLWQYLCLAMIVGRKPI